MPGEALVAKRKFQAQIPSANARRKFLLRREARMNRIELSGAIGEKARAVRNPQGVALAFTILFSQRGRDHVPIRVRVSGESLTRQVLNIKPGVEVAVIGKLAYSETGFWIDADEVREIS
jgi:primosomal replication protein N